MSEWWQLQNQLWFFDLYIYLPIMIKSAACDIVDILLSKHIILAVFKRDSLTAIFYTFWTFWTTL